MAMAEGCHRMAITERCHRMAIKEKCHRMVIAERGHRMAIKAVRFIMGVNRGSGTRAAVKQSQVTRLVQDSTTHIRKVRALRKKRRWRLEFVTATCSVHVEE